MSQRGLFYGWVVLAAAATVVAIGQGSLFALGVFLKPLEDSMRWSRSAISMTALINWMAMGAGSFFWGVLSDRGGSVPDTALRDGDEVVHGRPRSRRGHRVRRRRRRHARDLTPRQLAHVRLRLAGGDDRARRPGLAGDDPGRAPDP